MAICRRETRASRGAPLVVPKQEKNDEVPQGEGHHHHRHWRGGLAEGDSEAWEVKRARIPKISKRLEFRVFINHSKNSKFLSSEISLHFITITGEERTQTCTLHCTFCGRDTIHFFFCCSDMPKFRHEEFDSQNGLN